MDEKEKTTDKEFESLMIAESDEILNELFINLSLIKLLVKTDQWNKLIKLFKNHKNAIYNLQTRIRVLEATIEALEYEKAESSKERDTQRTGR